LAERKGLAVLIRKRGSFNPNEAASLLFIVFQHFVSKLTALPANKKTPYRRFILVGREEGISCADPQKGELQPT
jgi:hypothetical protein